MAGMSRITGALLDGLEHIRQSVADILGTMIGTRVARHEYRIRLRRVSLSAGERPGSATLIIDADRTDTTRANARTRLVLPLN